MPWEKSESESEVAQSCPTLCDPMDYSPPGSSVHGILQARGLEFPCPSPGDLPDPGIESESLTSPELAGGFFTANGTAQFAKYFLSEGAGVCVPYH